MDRTSARKELNGVFAMLAGMKLLLLCATLFLGRFLYGVLGKVFGESALQAYRQFDGYGTLSGILLEISVFLFSVAVPVCLYFFLSGRKYAELVPMKKPEFFQVCFGVGSTVTVGYAASYIGNILLYIFFSLFGMSDKYTAMLESDTSYPSNFWLVPLFALVLSVMPAFLEETTFRGISLGVTKKYGNAFAILFSGFFFGFMHSSWTQIPFAFVLGCLLAYFTLRFHTIWIAVASHFIFNFNSVVQCLIQENAGSSANLVSMIWFFLFMTLMVGLMIAGAIVYGVKLPKRTVDPELKKARTGILFRCPFLYVFLALELIQLIYLLLVY